MLSAIAVALALFSTPELVNGHPDAASMLPHAIPSFDSPEGLRRIADELMQRGQYAAAASLYRKVIVRRPKLVAVQLDLARALTRMGQCQSAGVIIQRYLQVYPTDVRARAMLESCR